MFYKDLYYKYKIYRTIKKRVWYSNTELFTLCAVVCPRMANRHFTLEVGPITFVHYGICLLGSSALSVISDSSPRPLNIAPPIVFVMNDMSPRPFSRYPPILFVTNGHRPCLAIKPRPPPPVSVLWLRAAETGTSFLQSLHHQLCCCHYFLKKAYFFKYRGVV